MKLTLFNGSPRGKRSNTNVLMDHFTRGFNETEENKTDTAYLFKTGDMEEFVRTFRDAERVILAFPLYTDAMPGIVKHFIEQLEPFCGEENNPDLGFVVQSGFPESHHSRFVERYLEKLARRLNCNYLGTVIRGGAELTRTQPESQTRQLFDSFYRLGLHFGKTGAFDEAVVRSISKMEKMPAAARVIFGLLAKAGLTNGYWNRMLKKNNAYDKRFDKPYEK